MRYKIFLLVFLSRVRSPLTGGGRDRRRIDCVTSTMPVKNPVSEKERSGYSVREKWFDKTA
jgi:hypothetical protein